MAEAMSESWLAFARTGDPEQRRDPDVARRTTSTTGR